MARRDVTEFERLYSEALTLAGGLRRKISTLLAELQRPDRQTLQESTRPPFRQCKFMRTLGNQMFQCKAVAKYGDYCGYHKPKDTKGAWKGCTERNNRGARCKATILRDGLCPAHWLKHSGHEYVRHEAGYRCHLCGSRFDWWQVNGHGAARKGSLKYMARCPAKEASKTTRLESTATMHQRSGPKKATKPTRKVS